VQTLSSFPSRWPTSFPVVEISTISLDDEVVEIGRDLDGVEVSKDLTSRSRGVGAEPYSPNFA
jgi:hypothetical protein